MTESFAYDIFVSHGSKDKLVVRSIVECLRADRLRAWFDEAEIRPGDSIPEQIEEGLNQSRVLLLCMSKNTLCSEWTRSKYGTFQFRAPLNEQRRSIPLRLDDAAVRGSPAQPAEPLAGLRGESRRPAVSLFLE